MSCRYLTFKDRQKLEELYSRGAELSDIAKTLGVHLATIYRELMRGSTGKLNESGKEGYSAELAQQTLCKSLKRRGRKQA